MFPLICFLFQAEASYCLVPLTKPIAESGIYELFNHSITLFTNFVLWIKEAKLLKYLVPLYFLTAAHCFLFSSHHVCLSLWNLPQAQLLILWKFAEVLIISRRSEGHTQLGKANQLTLDTLLSNSMVDLKTFFS